MTKAELRKEAIRLFTECDQCEPENDVFAFAVWNLLSEAAKDTLAALVKDGPLYDGDVPSKAGRDELLELGLANRACVKGEQGYQTANYIGWGVLKIGEASS